MLSLQLTTPNPESSVTALSLRPRIERQRRLVRISALSLQSNLGLLKRKVLPKPLRSRNIFRFLDLPSKIRNLVYKHYFALIIPSHIYVNFDRITNANASTSIPGPLPSLCHVNRRVREECTPLLFLHTELVLLNVAAVQCLTHYLQQPSHALLISSSHTLVFSSHISWRPHLTHTNKALLSQCNLLRHIKIEVPFEVCTVTDWKTIEEPGPEPGDAPVCRSIPLYRIRPKKEVIDQMDLCCLIDCKSLESLTLICRDGEVVAEQLGSREVVFMPLIVWVRKNLSCRGRLRLVVEYMDMKRVENVEELS